MRKIILVITTLVLVGSAGAVGYAQTTEPKDADKKPTTMIDTWKQALPEAEQNPNAQPIVAMPDSKDNVESEETTQQIEKRILDLERRLMEAVKLRDQSSLNQLLSDDFILAGVNTTGTQPDKFRFIEWASKNLELKSYTIGKTTVNAYPTTVIVSTNYKRQATVSGAPADGEFIVTDVWVKRGKRWRIVSHHISQLSKP